MLRRLEYNRKREQEIEKNSKDDKFDVSLYVAKPTQHDVNIETGNKSRRGDSKKKHEKAEATPKEDLNRLIMFKEETVKVMDKYLNH